ncbi:MAG: hypothetical protein ACOH1P_07310 [Lysobacter sp.]
MTMMKSNNLQEQALHVLCGLVVTAGLGGCATLASSSGSQYENSLAIAGAARQAGQTESALAAYRQALVEEPSSTQPWREIARIQAQDGQWAQAFTAAQQILQLEPEDAEAGELLVHSGLQVAGQALQRLQGVNAGQVALNREQGEALLAQMVSVFGVEAIPAEVLADIGKTVIEKHRSRRFRAPQNRPAQKVPEKTTADPFDVLGDG